MKNLLTALLFVCCTLSAFCQVYTLSGIIKDNDQKPIPMVGVFTKTGQGTFTNELGEFILKVSAVPAKITMSHLSYQAIEIEVANEKPVTIVLEESIKTLPEAKVGNYAFELLKKSIQKIKGDSIYNFFGKGFYRKIQKEGDKYTVLHEMFFNANMNGRTGMTTWQPTESRYTNHDGNVSNDNTFVWPLMLSRLSPRIYFILNDELIEIKDYTKHYVFEIESFYNENTPDEVAVVVCTPKKPFETDFAGRFYIKTSNGSMLNIKGRHSTTTKGWTHNFWFKIKEAYLDVNVNFREQDEVSIPLGVDLDYVLMVQYASSVNRKIVDSMKLIMYDYSPAKNGEEKTLKESLMGEENIFATTQASPEFWENNAIIKRTPVEDGIIKIFEGRKKKGGTMFPKK